jgi:catechol 2,3-dioxygenase-like lactoylglutathione lyase family enzyme
MAINRFDHAAINCRDITASKKFYTEILGLTAEEPVDMGECILHYMRLPDGSAVELFENKDRTMYDSLATKEGFLKHIAFNVDNIEDFNNNLIKNNIKFAMEMCVLEPLHVKALLCLDPDGVIIELSQKII